jgi:hypothetical protein
MWLWMALPGFSEFFILHSAFASGWLWTAFQGSKFKVQGSFDVGSWMFGAGC